jgi:hypothetical protein
MSAGYGWITNETSYFFAGHKIKINVYILKRAGWLKRDVTKLVRMGVFQRKNSHGVQYLKRLMHEPSLPRQSFFGVYQFSLFLYCRFLTTQPLLSSPIFKYQFHATRG